jgi:hypothetical protein
MAALDSKALILARAKTREVCDAYHEVEQATTFQEILQAGCGLYAYSYQANVVDDFILSDFPESDLNTFGVYRNDTTITNPEPSQYVGCKQPYLEIEEAPSNGQTLYAISSVNLTLNQSLNNKVELYAMGSSNVTVNINDISKLDLKIFNDATVNVIMNDQSVLCFQNNDNGNLIITANDESVTHGEGRSYSTTTYTGNNTTHAKFKTYTKSVLSWIKDVGATVDVFKYNKSIVNEGFLP